MLDATDDPGNEVLLGPHDIVFTCPTPVLRGERRRVKGLQIVWHVQRRQCGSCDRVVAQCVQMKPVIGPVARILKLLDGPLIHDDAIMTKRDLAKILVVNRHLATKRTEHGLKSDVHPGEHHDRGTGLTQASENVLELHRDSVRVCARADDVITASAHAHEVRSQINCSVELLFGDLANQFATDGKVRVGKIAVMAGEYLSEAVGPPAKSARTICLWIADTLSK